MMHAEPSSQSPLETDTRPDRLQTHWKALLLGLFALTTLLRLVYALQIRNSAIPELWRVTDSDMFFFVAWAKIIAAGDWLTNQALHPYFSWQRSIGSLAEWNQWYGGKTFHQAPLYPYALAGMFRAFGARLWPLYALQSIGSGLTAVLLASIGRRLFNLTGGLLAGIITAFYGPLLFYDFVVLRASLAVLASATIVWLLIRADTDDRWWRWLVAGLTMGLAYVLRENLAMFLVFALAAVTATRWQRWRNLTVAAGCMIAGFALPLVPVIARNACVGAPLTATSSIGATTFYLSNAAGAPGSGWGMLASFPPALRSSGGEFLPMARRAWQSHSSVGGMIELEAAKLLACLHYFERTNNANPYYAGQLSVLLHWGGLPYWLILPPGLAGLVLTWSRRRRCVWLYVGLLVPLATILLFYQTARLRVDLIVGLIPLAAAAVEWVIARRGPFAPVLLVTVVLCAIVRFPSSSDPPRIQPRDFAAAADVLAQVRRYDAAVAQATESVYRWPKDLRAWLTLIDAYRSAGETEDAAQACDRALQALPGSACVLGRRGDVWLDENRPDRAVAVYRSALRSLPRYVPAIVGMARALTAPGPSQNLNQALQLAQRSVRLAPNDPEPYVALAGVREAMGNREQAIAVLRTGANRLSVVDPERKRLERKMAHLTASTTAPATPQ